MNTTQDRPYDHHDKYYQAVPFGTDKTLRTYTVETLAPGCHCICYTVGTDALPVIDDRYPPFTHRSEAESVLDAEAVRLHYMYTVETPTGIVAHLANQPYTKVSVEICRN